MIDIKHHGATSGVTGSCHELVVGHAGILIDCGLFQGQEEGNGATATDLSIDFPIAHIRALVVTHVHIDHVGRIPYLLAAGFTGPILCSEPSALLLPEMLEDALKIGFTRDRELIERVLGLIRSRIVAVPYGQWQPVFEERGGAGEVSASLAIRLQRAGHILGSAYVECEARVGETAERIVFSGDLGAPHAPLLPEARPPERADRLVIESTYGDKDHEDRQTRRFRLKAILERALADRGTVLVPAFSLGRTQELLYEIESLIAEFGNEGIAQVAGKPLPWKDLEIVVDSPLAAGFTRLYRDLKPYWDEEARELVSAGRHPLSFEQLTVIDSHDDHLKAVDYLASSHRPCVVLAGSGMCAGGRIVNYLQAMLGDARNDVLFVGYQAAGTPGRDILTYGPRGGWVELEGKRYDIRARVHQVGGYSAHAGQSDLLQFIGGIPVKPAEIRIVHGEQEAKTALQRELAAAGYTGIMIPT